MPVLWFKPGDDMFANPADLLINTVNTVGVMGAGVALAFKKRYPSMFTEYRRRCARGEVTTGQIDLHLVHTTSNQQQWIANFPTKEHWKDPSRIEWIKSGLIDLVTQIDELELSTVAMPALGCGLGGLNWNEVSSLILDACAPLTDRDHDPVTLYIYPPRVRR